MSLRKGENMADNKKIAEDVLAAVGGRENITNVTHCMTRLRFNLKDDSVIDEDHIKEIKGVLGFVRSGGQNQIIIGQNVDKVYDEVCKLGDIAQQAEIKENLDKDLPKEKLTAKKVGSNIMNYLAGSLTPLIPLIIAAAMFKTVQVIIGPDMLNLVSTENDLYILFGLLYNAGFYYFPIYLGYTAAKKIGVTPVMGLFMGGILVAPDLIQMAANGTSFTVYGIPCMVGDYSQTVLPILLSIWIMSYIEKFFNKHTPTSIRTIFAPFLTMIVMVPISLCVLAPAGNIIGMGIGTVLISFGNVAGFIAVALIAALWEYLVMSGMHLVLAVTMITVIMQQGYESMVAPAACCATCAAFGMALGAALRTKDKEERSLNIGYFISGIVGGVTEPALYGTGFRYKRPLIGMSIGAAIGGLYAGLTHVAYYVAGATNFLMVLGYVGGGTANLVNGVISCVIALVGAAVATFVLGLEPKKKA
jgi:PTS system beta-glucosides-specific IIC component